MRDSKYLRSWPHRAYISSHKCDRKNRLLAAVCLRLYQKLTRGCTGLEMCTIENELHVEPKSEIVLLVTCILELFADFSGTCAWFLVRFTTSLASVCLGRFHLSHGFLVHSCQNGDKVRFLPFVRIQLLIFIVTHWCYYKSCVICMLRYFQLGILSVNHEM